MAALFAPHTVRQHLYQLYAFNAEIARIPALVSEAMIGQMRLAWAREAVSDLFASPAKVRRHDVYEGLADLLDAPGAPDRDSLETLIEARGFDLGEGVFESAAERLAYIDKTSVNLMRLAAQICLGRALSDEEHIAVSAAGRTWGLSRLIAAFAPLTEAGCPPLTQQELDDAGLSEPDLARGVKPQGVKQALMEGLLAEARIQRQTLNLHRKHLSTDLFPAMGYVALSGRYLKAAGKLTDPYRQQAIPGKAVRQLHLIWASLSGRI